MSEKIEKPKPEEKPKSPEQLLKEYDDAQADVASCVKAVAVEDKKPRTGPVYEALATARTRKHAAALAAGDLLAHRNTDKEQEAAKARADFDAKEQAKIDAEFAAKQPKK